MVSTWILLHIILFQISFSYQQSYIVPLANFRTTDKTIYENVAPIILRFTMPQNIPANLMVTGLPICSETTATAHCPLQYNLQIVRDLLRPLITTESLRQTSPLPTVDPFRISDCEKLGKHFTSEHINEAQLSSYKSQLHYCLSNVLVEKSNNSFATTDFSVQYRQAHQRYSTRYYQDSSQLDFQASHAIENSVLTIGGFLHFLSDALFWKEAFSSCKLQRIPRTVVKEDFLLAALIELEQKLEILGYSFVFPKEELGAYYNIPAADCTFIDGIAGSLDELVVRVLVPMTQQSNWQHNALQSIFFAHTYENVRYLCFHLPNEEMSTVIYNTATETELIPKYCDDNNLCHVGATSRHLRKSCSQKILSAANEMDIINFCPLNCEPIELFNFPVVVRGDMDTFYVTGPSSVTSQVIISCDGELDRQISLPEEGALQLKLPCNCHLNVQGLMYRPSTANCGIQPIVSDVVLPLHFKAFFNVNLKT